MPVCAGRERGARRHAGSAGVVCALGQGQCLDPLCAPRGIWAIAFAVVACAARRTCPAFPSTVEPRLVCARVHALVACLHATPACSCVSCLTRVPSRVSAKRPSRSSCAPLVRSLSRVSVAKPACMAICPLPLLSLAAFLSGQIGATIALLCLYCWLARVLFWLLPLSIILSGLFSLARSLFQVQRVTYSLFAGSCNDISHSTTFCLSRFLGVFGRSAGSRAQPTPSAARARRN